MSMPIALSPLTRMLHVDLMSPFPGLEQVATNISANILRLQERQPTGLGDSNDSGSFIERVGD